MPVAAPAELRVLAEKLVGNAAALVLDRVNSQLQVATKSSATDLVTEVDRETEQEIVAALAAARPGDGVLGEEGSGAASTTGVRWLIDPIDGTTNFVYGFPGFGISLAAEVDGEIVAGAVADPMHGEVYSAHRGGGATRNGQRLSVNGVSELSVALVATGFSYSAERRARQAHVLTTVLPQIRDIRRAGAASTDLCSVASGRTDAFYEKGLNPWDYAAGGLVASEAGAVVTDLEGGPGSPHFMLAAAPGIAEQLRLLLRGAGAADA